MGLWDKRGTSSRKLSGGMKRRLMIARALVHEPQLLILDEPTAGVDIELRRSTWSLLEEINAGGTTVILTTHYLEEAQSLCDRIAIINHGQVVACEDTPKLLAHIDNKEIRFRLDRELNAVPEGFAAYSATVEGRRVLSVRYRPGDQNVGDMIGLIGSAGYRIEDISTEESDLEDVFLQLTSSK